MKANTNLERRLAEHYASEPPLRAPDRVLLAALATIDTTRQRRGLLAPWRFTEMSMFSKAAAAAVLALAIGAIGLSFLAGPGGPRRTPSPSPTPSPTPLITPAPTPVAGVASAFTRPFSYVLPGVPRLDFGATNQTYLEVRAPDWADAGHPGGLIVQAVDGRVDPCDRASAVLPLEPGPQSVFDYLRTVPGVTVSGEAAATVDGRPARQATVLATPEAGCQEIWAWTEETESFINGVVLRLIAVDVDGQHVAITIFGEPDNPTWPELADAIVASFRFQPTASASP